MEDDSHLVLAEYLVTAFLAYQYDVTFETAKKTYIGNERIGNYWIGLAQRVQFDMAKEHGESAWSRGLKKPKEGSAWLHDLKKLKQA